MPIFVAVFSDFDEKAATIFSNMAIMKRFMIFAAAVIAGVAGAGAKIVTYPAGPSVTVSEDYCVSVRQQPETRADMTEGDWQQVAVYPVKVDEVRGTGHNVQTASMAYFDFDGAPAEVRVICRREAVKEARVRPLSYDIKPEISGDTLCFSMNRPCNMSVEVNGDIFHNLHLFANPIDTHRPSQKVLKNLGKHKNLLYFAPGVHRLPGDTLRLESGTTIYVDGGARVFGTLIADGANDVRIYGRGEIHPEGRGEGVYIKRSKNIDVDGVIVTQIPVGGSDSVNISNVKSISHYGWGDGMNVFASSNVNYDGVFCRNSDDCTTVYATRKGFRGGCRNISMANSVLWADVAHPIMIGLHGSAAEIGPDAPADTICNLLYRNIDILDHKEKQLDYQGCLTINCGDNNIVRDVTFDNIRIEDFREGQLFNIRIFYNDKYCAAPGTCIENVLIKDVTYNGRNSELSIIAGYDPTRKVSGITFDNLTINGLRIYDDMPGKPRWYKTGDMARIFIGEHVDNVTFK